MAKKPQALPNYKFKGSTPTDIPKDEKGKPGLYAKRMKGKST